MIREKVRTQSGRRTVQTLLKTGSNPFYTYPLINQGEKCG
jgi:hypothetical protein